MGWQKGLGIGKELQGRVAPVEAVVRQGKGSVGMYGRESKEIKAEVGMKYASLNLLLSFICLTNIV